MSVLSETLSRYLNWFQNNLPLEASYLQPGLTVKEIAEKVKALPFELPQEVYELYQWKNGAVGEYCFPLEYWMEFLPLEEALSHYHAISDILDRDWAPCDSNLFPLFILDHGKEYLLTECHKEQKERAVIIYYSPEAIYFSRKYESLNSMMLTIIECYETGAYSIDSDLGFQENSQKAGRIWRKYNTELAESALNRLQGEL